MPFPKICRALSSINHCRAMSYIIGRYFCRPRINRLCELKRDLHFVIVEDIDRAVEAVGKLSKSVVRAAVANSNKGSPIVIWPRTTSGFTSNCPAGYPQRDLWSVPSLRCLIADLRALACVLFNWTLDVRR